LSVIAHTDAKGDAELAATAFARGAQAISLPNAQLVASQAAKPKQLEQAIERLSHMSPFAKRNLLSGCAEVAASDGHLSADEIDLLRALGELWDCPMPLTVDE